MLQSSPRCKPDSEYSLAPGCQRWLIWTRGNVWREMLSPNGAPTAAELSREGVWHDAAVRHGVPFAPATLHVCRSLKPAHPCSCITPVTRVISTYRSRWRFFFSLTIIDTFSCSGNQAPGFCQAVRINVTRLPPSQAPLWGVPPAALPGAALPRGSARLPTERDVRRHTFWWRGAEALGFQQPLIFTAVICS